MLSGIVNGPVCRAHPECHKRPGTAQNDRCVAQRPLRLIDGLCAGPRQKRQFRRDFEFAVYRCGAVRTEDNAMHNSLAIT